MTLQIEQWGIVPYHLAHDRQMQLVEKLHGDKNANDVCMILQHPPVFTLGRNATAENVTAPESFLQKKKMELIKTERGGDVTYHGPGQIICYPIVHLRRNKFSVIDFVHTLEQIMLAVVRRFGLEANRDSRNHGIWLGDRKLGSVGIAVRHGISYHGLALNVNIDLEPFDWITPCGLTGISMSSMERDLQQSLDIDEVETAVIEEAKRAFQRPVKRAAKPKWLKQCLPKGSGYERIRRMVKKNGLHTVCQEARCPNQFECFGKGTATFMLMGENCTRNCRFCAVSHGATKALDADEPAKIAEAVYDMKLKYVVLTSVTRDDLPDGGAEHFSKTIKEIRTLCPKTYIEILIPDLQGNKEALETICLHKPSVVNHNVETVAGLYPEVHPQALYDRSLALLKRVKVLNPSIVTKSGLMLGLGETEKELQKTIADIRKTGCDLLTLGQYLQPTINHLAVQNYVPPEEFDRIRKNALEFGFAGVAAGPHVRSSYQAGELYKLTH